MDNLPRIECPAIGLEGQFYTSWEPIQAWGTIGGHKFYFRAKSGEWEFSVSDVPIVDPIEIETAEQGFYREGSFGTQAVAMHEAQQTILNCAREFLATKSPLA